MSMLAFGRRRPRWPVSPAFSSPRSAASTSRSGSTFMLARLRGRDDRRVRQHHRRRRRRHRDRHARSSCFGGYVLRDYQSTFPFVFMLARHRGPPAGPVLPQRRPAPVCSVSTSTAVEPEVAEAPPESPPRAGSSRPPAMRGVPVRVLRDLPARGRALPAVRRLGPRRPGPVTTPGSSTPSSSSGFYFVFGMLGTVRVLRRPRSPRSAATRRRGPPEKARSASTRSGSACVFAVGREPPSSRSAFSLLMRKATHFYFAIATARPQRDRPPDPATVDGVHGRRRRRHGRTSVPIVRLRHRGRTRSYRIFSVLLVAARARPADRHLARALAGEARGDRRPRPGRRGRHPRRCRRCVCASAMFVLGSTLIGARRRVAVRALEGLRERATTSALDLAFGIFVMLIVGGIDSLWGPMHRRRVLRVRSALARRVGCRDLRTRATSYARSSTAQCCSLVMIVAFPGGLVGVGLFQRLRGSFDARADAPRSPHLAHRLPRPHPWRRRGRRCRRATRRRCRR